MEMDTLGGKTTTTVTTPSDNSIEEEIEEVISSAGSGLGLSSCADDAVGVGVKSDERSGAQNAELSVDSDADLENKKGAPTNEEKNSAFHIDDDQLSGGKLTQHFVFEEDDDDNDGSFSLQIEKEISEQQQEGEQPNEVDKESLTNQSTANDVSDLVDETNQEDLSQMTLSLPEGKPNDLNVLEKRSCASLDTQVNFFDLPLPSSSAVQKEDNTSESPVHSDKDHSIEEIFQVNHSIEMKFDETDLSSLDIQNETLINRFLGDTPVEVTTTSFLSCPITKEEVKGGEVDDDDDDESNLEKMRQRIHAMKQQKDSIEENVSSTSQESPPPNPVVKQMERISAGEFTKDILEDITEESEKNSLSISDKQLLTTPLPPTSAPIADKSDKSSSQRTLLQSSANESSIISLNMIQMLESKVAELQGVVSSKDACLASLNLQLDSAQRRESGSVNGSTTTEHPPSGRESSSLITTTSTEYRTFQEDFGAGVTMDFYTELTKRDELIAKLTDSLQQSMNIRENLQSESEKLTTEVQLLRKQLTETMESMRRSYWPRDQESNGGQRISEISMDLVSESDDDLDRHYLTDNEEKVSRNSRERQLSMPRQMDCYDQVAEAAMTTSLSKQIEQFQKYLSSSELRLFFMVQKKFDDFLSAELEKTKMKYETEMKIMTEQLESDKHDREIEINRLRQMLTQVKSGSSDLLQLRQEMEAMHSKEMADLRQYFEKKCADLEKQYSDEVFSHKSQRNGSETSSSSSSTNVSDEENMPEELVSPSRSKESLSTRKKSRAELILSPSHRQLTPSGDGNLNSGGSVSSKNVSKQATDDLKSFYKSKIQEITKNHEEIIRKLNEKLKHYESRYPEDDFMITPNPLAKDTTTATAVAISTTNNPVTINHPNPSTSNPSSDLNVTSLLITDQDELNLLNNESQVRKIIDDYDRRLQEQVALAREDIVRELADRIQSYLSETTTDDHHWPPELILLREKFTAKSQLEIAQLQIKHEEEMSRLKVDYDKQINRKQKRNSHFDLSRDLHQIISERDGLRELSKTFRHVLAELAKCVSVCEDDMSATFKEEMQKILANRTLQSEHELDLDLNNSSSVLNSTFNSIVFGEKQMRFVPDVTPLLEVVENPLLLEYISNSYDTEEFDLKNCLERLNVEAAYLLHLSEDLHKKNKRKTSESSGAEKNDSCCEGEDGQKNTTTMMNPIDGRNPQKLFVRANSLNGDDLFQGPKQPHHLLSSLPPDLNRMHQLNEFICDVDDGDFTSSGPASELNFQVHELKNRLVKSESDRLKLQQELEDTINRNAELGAELTALRDQLNQLDSYREEFTQGYGLAMIKNPQRIATEKPATTFAQLQEKARNILTTPTQQHNNSTAILLQMIEDFCREGDKVVENGKKDRDDLQSQIDTADKQLKATRQFLEEQAAEREQERDEFLREIDSLKVSIRDKEKERNYFENASKETEQLEQQVKDLAQTLAEATAKKDKFEIELKASIDKIFVLREIITELETQVEKKSLNERVMREKVQQLEDYVNSQNRSNETLHQEVQSLKTEICDGYQEKIRVLEEKLQNARPAAEQSLVMEQVIEQLRDIETTLDAKTKTLESLHHSVSSISCSTSPTEDVSVQGTTKPIEMSSAIVSPPQGSPVHPSPRQHSLSIEGVQRVLDKLSKHTRVEEAAIKRIRDLEMQVSYMRSSCVGLQHERDTLQERMSEQMQRISVLQSRLEEQRNRAEELQRTGTSDLNIRIHDLQNEVMNLKETLSARDKQVANMRNQLEKGKSAIDRLEAELSVGSQADRSVVERLEADLKARMAENQKLKDKIKTEMINKLALPDLMETMLCDKNDEIDHLKEQLELKEKQLQAATLQLNLSQAAVAPPGANSEAAKDVSTKLSARTLSDIISLTEFDEPDVIRRAIATDLDTPLVVPHGEGALLQQTMETSKEAVANLTEKRSADLAVFSTLHPERTFDHPQYFQDPNIINKSAATITPSLVPRQINFSELSDDSKLKECTPHTFGILKTPISSQNLAAIEKLQTEKNLAIERLQKQLQEANNSVEALQQEKAAAVTQTQNELKSSIENKESEFKTLEEDFIATQLRLGGLQDELDKKTEELTRLQAENQKLSVAQQQIADKSSEIMMLIDTVESLEKANKEKSDAITKYEKNLANFQQNEESYVRRIAELEERIQQLSDITKRSEDLSQDLHLARAELSTLRELHAKCSTEIESHKRKISEMTYEEKRKESRLVSLNTQLSNECDRIAVLEEQNSSMHREIEKLRHQQNSDSSKQFSVDEIAQQVAAELNYSAQLDSNILKAIESEEENNFDVAPAGKTDSSDEDNFIALERDLLNQVEALRAQIEIEREHSEQIRKELLFEKQHSQEIQEQDVAIIEAMRKRLEDALAKEEELHRVLDDERDKCERLMTQVTVLQRVEARKSSSLLKSPTESPRRSPRSSDFESDLADRLKSELKLLTAQNERERERVADLQRNFDRERSRFDTELNDRIEYSERLKKEMDKVARDKELAEQEVEHLQERLTLQAQEIQSLEARIATLQEAETRRANRRDRQRVENTQNAVELQELKAKILNLETECDHLNKTKELLRYDIERGAQREAKLAEALVNSSAVSETSIPQQFLQKMKDINILLAENTKENRQMADTVQFLVQERRTLQKKCETLESQLGSNVNVTELEERANHLLGRYLRVESHRKALVYQKRYLKVSLQSYQESELRAKALINGDITGTGVLLPKRPDKKRLFKTVALSIIAIQRMKFIGRLWQTGKRIVSKSVFTITQQKRSRPTTDAAAISTSPPCRDIAPLHSPFNLVERPLQSPALLNECAQKFDWSRLLQQKQPKHQ